MAQKSLKYNFTLNFINTIAGLLFPLLTFPYVARILDPDGLGLVGFYQSIVSYIVIFSSLGINLYAVRAIARVKDKTADRDKTAIEILLLHLLLSLAGYIVVGILCLTIHAISAHQSLFLILSVPIFFNAIGVNWFYQAMEDFRYITIRSLAFKMLGAVALFIFVKDRADITSYAIILVLADVGNNIFNLLRLRKYINRTNIRPVEMNVIRHLKPATVIFTLNVIISLYLGLSPIVIGFMVDDAAVGYFMATSRLTTAALSIVTALGTTLTPRMSYYASRGETELFNTTAGKGLNFIIAISLPISIGMAIVAPELITSFSGVEFAPAIPTMMIMSPTIFIIGIAAILGYQILYPKGLEKIIIRCSLFGTLTYMFGAFTLTHFYSQNGTAMAYALAELTVTISLIIYTRPLFPYNYFNRSNLMSLAAVSAMGLAVYMFHHFINLNPFMLLAGDILVGIFTYAIMAILVRHPLLSDITPRKLFDRNGTD